MLSPLSDYTFQIVAAGTMLLGLASGVTGTFAVLRKESLIGDGLSHASFPGVVAAFMFLAVKDLEVLLTGAAVASLLCMAAIALTVRYTKVKFDAALATFLAAFFGVGMMLMTYVQHTDNPNQAGLSKFIFGQAATMLARDVEITAAVAVMILLLAVIFWKELKLVAFDADFARSLQLPVRMTQLVYGLMLVASIIIGLQSVGAILMSSLLIAPAVAARQWTDNLGIMAVLAGGIGALSCGIGTYASAIVKGLPTGPAIVVAASIVVLLSLLFAPGRGIIARYRVHREARRRWKEGDINVRPN